MWPNMLSCRLTTTNRAKQSPKQFVRQPKQKTTGC